MAASPFQAKKFNCKIYNTKKNKNTKLRIQNIKCKIQKYEKGEKAGMAMSWVLLHIGHKI